MSGAPLWKTRRDKEDDQNLIKEAKIAADN